MKTFIYVRTTVTQGQITQPKLNFKNLLFCLFILVVNAIHLIWQMEIDLCHLQILIRKSSRFVSLRLMKQKIKKSFDFELVDSQG